MGVAVFVGLVLIAVVVVTIVIGFVTYGSYLGLARLARLSIRSWLQLAAPDEEIDSNEAGGLRVGVPGSQTHQRWLAERCWEIKRCPIAIRESCPAYRRPDLPCWQACMQAGADPAFKPECLACRLFNLTKLIA